MDFGYTSGQSQGWVNNNKTHTSGLACPTPCQAMFDSRKNQIVLFIKELFDQVNKSINWYAQFVWEDLKVDSNCQQNFGGCICPNNKTKGLPTNDDFGVKSNNKMIPKIMLLCSSGGDDDNLMNMIWFSCPFFPSRFYFFLTYFLSCYRKKQFPPMQLMYLYISLKEAKAETKKGLCKMHIKKKNDRQHSEVVNLLSFFWDKERISGWRIALICFTQQSINDYIDRAEKTHGIAIWELLDVYKMQIETYQNDGMLLVEYL